MSEEKQALQEWAKANKITAANFARATGYSYQHAWRLLAGDTEPTTDTLGRIVVGFGSKTAAPIIKTFQNKTRQPMGV